MRQNNDAFVVLCTVYVCTAIFPPIRLQRANFLGKHVETRSFAHRGRIPFRTLCNIRFWTHRISFV